MAHTRESFPVTTTEKGEDGKSVKVNLPDALVEQFSLDEAGFKDACAFYASEEIKEKGEIIASGGVAFIMERFNTQTATDARNKIRAEYTKEPSAASLLPKAFAALVKDAALFSQYQALAGDDAGQQAILDKVIESLKAEYSSKKRAALSANTSAPAEGEEVAA